MANTLALVNARVRSQLARMLSYVLTWRPANVVAAQQRKAAKCVNKGDGQPNVRLPLPRSNYLLTAAFSAQDTLTVATRI